MRTETIKPEELVELGLYKDEQEVLEEGIRHILRLHPEYKIEIAVKRYKDEQVSLGKAADIAGISIEEIKEILRARGIAMKGPESVQEVNEDAERTRQAL